jgi:GntP family gluconate:H+ symporter
MVALIIAFPGLVTGGLAKKAAVNTDQMRIEVPAEEPDTDSAPLQGEPGAAPDAAGTEAGGDGKK